MYAAFYQCWCPICENRPTQNLMEPSWKVIIDGCKRNERQFQMEAYERSWRIVFPAIYRIIQNKQEAEDVMQDSIIKGFEKLTQLSDPNAYIGWQKSISVRAAYNYIRDKKRHAIDFPNLDTSETEIDFDIELPESEKLWNVLNSLANGYQTVVKMHLLDGLSHEEIADIIGVAPSTVRSQYSRALNRIKVIIHSQQQEHV